MEEITSHYNLVGHAYEVDKLPKEIQDLIGGYSKALIMPIKNGEAEEVKEKMKKEYSECRSLRDCLVVNCEGGENNSAIKVLDRCYGMLEKANKALYNGGKVSLEYFKWIVDMYDEVCLDLPSTLYINDELTFDNNLECYTNNMYNDLLQTIYSGYKQNLSFYDEYKDIFKVVVAFEDGDYVLEEIGRYQGLENYIISCLKYDK